MKFDMHVHTYRSPDSLLLPETIVKTCLEKGLSGIAITDHNTIKGAMEMKKMAPFTVIVGEEINTSEGEVIGYFLKDEIPAGLGIKKTLSMIKDQGGLVCIPHPFDKVRRSRTSSDVIDQIIESIDIIEAYNSRNLFASSNKMAILYAKKYRKLVCAGSDAHLNCEVGNAYIEIDEFNSPEQFLANLRYAQLIGKNGGLWVHILTKGVKFAAHWAR